MSAMSSMAKTTPRIEVPERAGESPSAGGATPKIAVRHLDFFYGKAQALHDVSLEIPERIVMAFIGPSGCGKSTLLRTMNRMNDVIPATRVAGEVSMDGHGCGRVAPQSGNGLSEVEPVSEIDI